MTSPYLLFAGAGMVLVGAFATVYWWKKGVEIKYFLYGALAWGSAIGIKVLLDLTPFNDFLMRKFTLSTFIILTGIYVGLRTGILENGITYIFSKKMRMNFTEGTAFGIGFGGTEAIILGSMSLISVSNLLLTESSFTQDPQIIFAPIIERVFVLFGHIFSCLLVIHSVHTQQLRYFLCSVLYKSSIDGIIPWMQQNISGTVKEIYMMEIPVVLFGVIGIVGILRLKEVME